MKAFLVLLMLLLPLTAFAQDKAPASPAPVLVVDMKRVLDESKAAESVQRKIEVRRSEFQKEIAGKEDEIRGEEQELLQSRGKMEAKTYSEKEDQLRQKFRDVETYVVERRRVLEQATTDSMGHVRSVLQTILTDIAKKKGAKVVLNKQLVLWSEPALDVTDDVLANLNKQLPDMDVVIQSTGDGAKDAKPAPAKAPVKTPENPQGKTPAKPPVKGKE